MPSANRIIISAAGGGKTTRVVEQSLAATEGATALVTYTRNNVREIERKVYERIAAIPPHVEIISWYSFLLRELARPYRSALHRHRIEGIHWVEGRSVQYVPEVKIDGHYFLSGTRIYSDKIAKFICVCDARTGGAVMSRLRQRFGQIIVDEVQDMAGYDLDVLELILKAGIIVTLVGDHRQAILSTNNSSRHKHFAGPAIIKKFRAWEKAGLASITYEQHTHRCNQAIADLGDSFFPGEPKTVSNNQFVTGHDGVFLVGSADADAYVARYTPQVLRYNVKTACGSHDAINFGESKGMTFPRVLVFPHLGAKKWLATGSLAAIDKSVARMYVAATRARYSVAFVYDGKECAIAASRWDSAAPPT
ncbi:UvrD-helicase domain-containing protein [Mesorhizobium sp. M1143]|uniref:UvrD-helicase domain-containing protein n=1 Tax=Mesorhizobium sp. M1143 TaxID=2957061 RepID=UPI0033371E43